MNEIKEVDKTFGKQLKKIMQIRNLSNADVARIMGVSRGMITHYLNYTKSPKMSTVKKLSESLMIKSSFFFDDIDIPEDIHLKFSDSVKIFTGVDLVALENSIKNEPNFKGVVKGLLGIDEDDVKIPLFSSISCGDLQSIDNILVDHVNVPKRLKNRFGEDLFSVRAKGDSMNNVILDGNIAVFSKSAEVKNGDIVAVLVNGEEATMKRITKTNYAIVLEPDSSNPDHTPIFIDCVKEDCNEVQVLGKLVYSFNEFE